MEVAIATQELIKECRSCVFSQLKLHNFKEVDRWDDLVVTTFVDASGINRPKGGRTGGAIVCIAPPQVLAGETVNMSLVAWRSWRLERVCLDTNSAEIQATTVGEDLAYKIRLLWGELHGAGHHILDPKARAKEVVSRTRLLLGTDSKGGTTPSRARSPETSA